MSENALLDPSVKTVKVLRKKKPYTSVLERGKEVVDDTLLKGAEYMVEGGKMVDSAAKSVKDFILPKAKDKVNAIQAVTDEVPYDRAFLDRHWDEVKGLTPESRKALLKQMKEEEDSNAIN